MWDIHGLVFIWDISLYLGKGTVFTFRSAASLGFLRCAQLSFSLSCILPTIPDCAPAVFHGYRLPRALLYVDGSRKKLWLAPKNKSGWEQMVSLALLCQICQALTYFYPSAFKAFKLYCFSFCNSFFFPLTFLLISSKFFTWCNNQ